MTPQEKAIQLVEAYWEKIIHDDDGDRNDMCKECALLAVDEILKENSKRGGDNDEIIEYEPYWFKVKQEIEKL